MKKHGKRRARQQPPAGDATSLGQLSNAAQNVVKREKSTRSRIWGWWKEIWAFVGPLVTITVFYSFIAPNVTISTTGTMDPEQPFATLFVIRNTGNFLSANDVGFGCGLTGRFTGGPGSFMGFESKQMRPIKFLGAGEAVTRSCIPSTSGFANDDSLDISVLYRVPFIGWERSVAGHFRVMHGTPGYFLVPDKP